MGVPLPAQRLSTPSSAIFDSRGQQLVDHTRRGARLSLDVYLKRLDCQALCNPLRNLERFSSHANVCVSEIPSSIQRRLVQRPVHRSFSEGESGLSFKRRSDVGEMDSAQSHHPSLRRRSRRAGNVAIDIRRPARLSRIIMTRWQPMTTALPGRAKPIRSPGPSDLTQKKRQPRLKPGLSFLGPSGRATGVPCVPKTSFLDLRERCGATCKYRCSPVRFEGRAAFPRDPKAH